MRSFVSLCVYLCVYFKENLEEIGTNIIVSDL